jgi:hypothetical protein
MRVNEIFGNVVIMGETDEKFIHDIEECRLLGCGVVYILCKPTFRRNVSPPSAATRSRWFLAHGFLYPENRV